MIIDVRSDSEFSDDHIPGAVSMPVLDDTERAEIGTMYKQVGAFEEGAAWHWSRVTFRAILKRSCRCPEGFRSLVYCWRGGQRSAPWRVS